MRTKQEHLNWVPPTRTASILKVDDLPGFPLWPSVVVTTLLGAGLFGGAAERACGTSLLWFLSCLIAFGFLTAAIFPPMRGRRFARAALWIILPNVGFVTGEIALSLQIDESARRGDRIAEALKTYRTREGEYPRSLDDLVPTDLERIPASAMCGLRGLRGAEGPPFHYSLIEGEEFTLSFSVALMTFKRRHGSGPWSEEGS